MKKTILISVITGVLSLTIGIFGGMSYQKSKQLTVRQNMNGLLGSATGMRNGTVAGSTTSRDNLMKNNAPVSGKIISMDDTSITVQTQDGSNKIVLISEQTTINKTTAGIKTDLSVGAEVMVIGNTSNGAVSAQSISLGGNFMRTPAAPTPSTMAK